METITTAKNEQRWWSKEYIYIVLVNFCLIGAFYLVAPILPLFSEQTQNKVSEEQINLAVGVMFIFPTLVFRPISGYFCDRNGYKSIGLIAIGLMIVSFIGYSVVNTGDQLIAWRLVHGVAYGLSIPPVKAYCTRIIPKGSIKGQGYFSASGDLAMTVTSTFSLFMAEIGHFWDVFKVGIVFTLIGFILFSVLKKPEMVRENTVDHQEDEKSMTLPQVFKVISPFAAIMGLVTIYTAGVTIYIYPFSKEMGFNSHAYKFMLVNSLVILFGRVLVSSLARSQDSSEKGLGRGRLITVSYSCFAIGLLCLSFGESLLFFYIAAVANGMGLSCLAPCVYSLAVDCVPKQRKAIATAIFYTVYDLGAMLPPVGNVLRDWLGAGYQGMWMMDAPCMVFSAVLAYQLIIKKSQVIGNETPNK
jgi:MFS family permease